MQLYVGGLSEDTTEEDISGLFAGVCPVESVTVARDLETGRSRGFGMVKVSSSEQVEEAIGRLNGALLKGRPVRVGRMPETLPGEMEFREWLVGNAQRVLAEVGVREGQTVLDYGCGSGTFSIPCARIVGAEGRVYALEVRAGVLERLREQATGEGLANIVTILSEQPGADTGLPEESVDVVLVYDVMHAVEDRPALLRELYRVLRRDGFLSVFPMHLGTDSLLRVMDECGLFDLRDRYAPPGYEGASEVVNFRKRQ